MFLVFGIVITVSALVVVFPETIDSCTLSCEIAQDPATYQDLALIYVLPLLGTIAVIIGVVVFCWLWIEKRSDRGDPS